METPSLLKRTLARKGASTPKGTLRFWMLLEIAFKNLFSKKLRTTLTMIGVIVGIGAVLFLLAFGLGLRQVVTDQVVDSNSIRTIDVTPAKAQLVKLNSENISRIKQTTGVVSVAPIYYYAGKTNFNNARIESVVYGVDQQYADLSKLNRAAGQAPVFGGNEVIANTAYSKALGLTNPEQLVGKELNVTIDVLVPSQAGEVKKTISYKSRVLSVVESGNGAELYVASSVFRNAGVDTASQLKVLVDNKSSVSNVQKKVETLGFTSTSPLQTLEQINQFFIILNLLFVGFGGIGLLIATLGMFNTLTVSLLERTKEIGLMVALGARRRDIRRLFIVESVALSVLGGGLGVVSTFGSGALVNTILQRLSRSRGVTTEFSLFSFPAWLILAVMAFSFLLGLLVVILPARRAVRINPIQALKI